MGRRLSLTHTHSAKFSARQLDTSAVCLTTRLTTTIQAHSRPKLFVLNTAVAKTDVQGKKYTADEFKAELKEIMKMKK